MSLSYLPTATQGFQQAIDDLAALLGASGHSSMNVWLTLGIAFLVVVLLLGLLSRRSRPTHIIRASLMTPAELAFLSTLDRAVGDRYRVMGKPRIADVLNVKGGGSKARFQALRKMFGKHFDFALCDPGTLRVLAVIELDDKSHERRDRRGRDAYVNFICQQAGLPLIRFVVSNRYGADQVSARVTAAVSGRQ